VIVGIIRRKPVLTHASIVCEDMLASVNSVNSVKNWSDEWLLRLNIDKCKTVSYYVKNPICTEYHITHENNRHILHILDKLGSVNDLGVVFDSNLSFRDHISHKINKAYSILGIIIWSPYVIGQTIIFSSCFFLSSFFFFFLA